MIAYAVSGAAKGFTREPLFPVLPRPTMTMSVCSHKDKFLVSVTSLAKYSDSDLISFRAV